MPRSVTEAERLHLEEHGYTLIPGFLSPDELAEALHEVEEYVPPWDRFSAERESYKHIAKNAFDWIEFPFNGPALNRLAVSPEVLSFVEAVLGTNDLSIAYCLLWPKYAGTFDFEQDLHVDYRRHMLVFPRDDGRFRLVPFILYLTDVTIDLGPTWVVSQMVTGKSTADVNGAITRDVRPDAAAEQTPVLATAGSLLAYSMRTFHRGSAMTATAGHRFTYNFGYRASDLPWGWRMWGQDAERPEMQRFIVSATPAQRAVFGFPAPGHDYWNDEMLEAVAARYPDLDMEPYRRAARG